MQRRDRSSPLACRKPDRFVLGFAAQFLLVGFTPDTDTLGHVQVYLYPQQKPTSPGKYLIQAPPPSTPSRIRQGFEQNPEALQTNPPPLLLIVVTTANSSSVLLLTVVEDTTTSSSPYCCSSSNNKSISSQKKYRPRAIFYLLFGGCWWWGLVVL